MINVLTQPDSVLKGLILSKPTGLYVKRRDEQMLVVNPRLGLYSILSEPFVSFFRKLRKPVSYNEFIENDQGIPPAMYVAFMEEAYRRGILALSGKMINTTAQGIACANSTRTVFIPLSPGSDPMLLSERLIEVGRKDNYRELLINFRGNPASHLDKIQQLYDFLEKELGGGPLGVSFAFDLETPGDAQHVKKLHTRFPVNLNYSVYGGRDDHDAKAGAGSFDRVMDAARNAMEEGYYPSVTGIFDDPAEVLPAMTPFVKKFIPNLGVRIDRKVILDDRPVTARIRTMEAFAHRVMDLLDLIYQDKHFHMERIFLNDLQRIVMRLLHQETVFACGRWPCGMGSQVMVMEGPDTTSACLAAGPKSREALKMPHCNGTPALGQDLGSQGKPSHPL